MTTQDRSTLFNQIALALQGMRDGWSTLEFNVQCAQIVLNTAKDVGEDVVPNIVEIGVYGGRTTIAIALALKALDRGAIHAIDPWDAKASVEGQIHPNDQKWWGELDHERIYRGFQTAVDSWGVRKFVEVHRARSDEVVSPGTITLLIVDGNHGPESIRDVGRFAPSVPAGGWCYLDDLDWTGGAVRQAERDLMALGFEFAIGRDKGAFYRRTKVLAFSEAQDPTSFSP